MQQCHAKLKCRVSIYVMLAHVFTSKPHLPCQLVGTEDHPALWIVDEAAAQKMASA